MNFENYTTSNFDKFIFSRFSSQIDSKNVEHFNESISLNKDAYIAYEHGDIWSAFFNYQKIVEFKTSIQYTESVQAVSVLNVNHERGLNVH